MQCCQVVSAFDAGSSVEEDYEELDGVGGMDTSGGDDYGGFGDNDRCVTPGQQPLQGGTGILVGSEQHSTCLLQGGNSSLLSLQCGNAASWRYGAPELQSLKSDA